MIYPYGSLKFPTPYSDTRVDNIIDQDGVIDQFAPISLEIEDDKLIENINQRIEDSKTYYNDTNGFDLEQKRSENLRMYLGIQANSADFYEQEEPYIENQIRGAVDSIVAYATARSPQSVVTPAEDTPQAKKFAANLEKAHNLHSVKFDLRGLIEVCVRSWMLNQAAYLTLEFDPGYGENGEIIPKFIPCDELVVDKNARYGENPEFIATYEKHTIEELVYRFPEKRQEIFDSVSIKRPGSKNMTQEVVTKKVWFTYYGKGGKPMEAIAIYYSDVMLCKYQDINWLHGRKNFLDAPVKPIVPLNVINDGKHWIDFSTPLEDGIRMQKLLNARGRQISMNASRSNGTTIIDGKASGLTKEDAENWTGGPNQKIFLKKKASGVHIQDTIYQLPGQDVKQFVVQDKQDMRTQLFGVMSVPADQTGADVTSDDPTLGEQLLKKSSAEGRQDMIVRALDRMLYKYFNLLTQMMFVWYDDEHFFSFLDADGSFERIIIKRYYFDDGMTVNVKGSSTIAFDKNREQAMALHFTEHDKMALIDAYRIAGFENPQKLYDNWAKQQKDPFELVRDANNAYDDGDAYAEFLDIINGKMPNLKQEASKDFILTLRKLMLTDKYLKANSKYQKAFNDRLQEYLDLYELRQALDQLSELDMGRIAPDQPIPKPQSEQQPSQMGMPGASGGPPGMGVPGAPAQSASGMMLPGMQQPPLPQPGMGGGGVFNGTPLMNPGAPQTPSGVSAIPSI